MSNAELPPIQAAPPRVLVLGANGGLGRALVRELASTCRVTAWTRAELDLTQTGEIAKKLQPGAFDVVLNPAGLTNPDACEAAPELADILNTQAPAAVAAACRQKGIRFIHFSTDYVFSGEGQKIWTEDDLPCPVNTYGRSKLAGEQAALDQGGPDTLIARVSWVFGPDKASHPDQVIAKALQMADLSAIADKTSAPTYSLDICHWISRIIHHHPTQTGVLHLCNSGVASWQSWAETSLQIAQRNGWTVLTTQVKSTRLEDATFFKAPRPQHTTLSNQRLARLLGAAPRDWQAALEEYLAAKSK